jgi:hypothetical protein
MVILGANITLLAAQAQVNPFGTLSAFEQPPLYKLNQTVEFQFFVKEYFIFISSFTDILASICGLTDVSTIKKLCASL